MTPRIEAEPWFTECENHDDVAAVGSNGNMQLLCERCIFAEYEYALQHVPEAMNVSYRQYLTECEQRLASAAL